MKTKILIRKIGSILWVVALFIPCVVGNNNVTKAEATEEITDINRELI